MRKNRLIIVGAGDFSREVLWAASEIPIDGRDWDIAGCLDDRPDEATEVLRTKGIDLPVLDRIRDYTPREDDRFISAIGSPKAKLTVSELLQSRGAEFINLIHPTAAVAPKATLGVGVFLWRYAMVSVNVRVGDHVTMNCYTTVGHDAVLEDGCTLSGHCDVTGHVHLERGVFMGSHSAVIPNVRVGAFATIGAGTVVFRKVPPGATVVGVPAKAL